jgi:hypothetical protein
LSTRKSQKGATSLVVADYNSGESDGNMDHNHMMHRKGRGIYPLHQKKVKNYAGRKIAVEAPLLTPLQNTNNDSVVSLL